MSKVAVAIQNRILPITHALVGMRGARDKQRSASRFEAGLKPRPSGHPTQNGGAW
jgi:hypothetical protein